MHRRATVRFRIRHLDAWLAWLLGATMLGALIAAAFHYFGRASLRAPRAARQALVAACRRVDPGRNLYGAGRYLETGRGARGGQAVAPDAFELGLAKLFADQALPSAGVSSSVLVARALEERGLPQPAVRAAVLVNIASYHLAYVIALTPALAIVVGKGTSPIVAGIRPRYSASRKASRSAFSCSVRRSWNRLS
jgi:Mg2+-importing ATPase